MKPRFSNQRTNALTLIEVLVIIAVLAVLGALLIPVTDNKPMRSPRRNCVNNLRTIGIACQLWANDHNGKYPMEISVTNGGTMELADVKNVWQTFLVMSNEINHAKILYCPADIGRVPATNFNADFGNANISYFIALDADENKPRTFLSGDDNFAMNGVPVKSGRLEISTNTLLFWTGARHKFAGNIGLADGSVQQLTTDGLRQALQQTGVATNRLAIP
jgi:prepilin-type processing-associated H-X9-DG protein